MSRLPDFRLETYFSKWEFNTKYNLCASDSESLSFNELLEISREEDKALLDNMSFGYTETYGDKKLREIIASLYEDSSYKDILTFSGAEEAIYISMKSILDRDDHAIVFAPNYQSAQTLPQSICDVTVLNLNPNEEWNINLDQLKSSIKKNTKLISINFPHNPTGKIISRSDQNEIIKICRENNAPFHSNNGGAATWYITQWEQGVTEPGSSGSPLFDQNHRIIGQLYGGAAACSGTVDNNQYDYYGRMGVSWNNGIANYLSTTACGSSILTNDGWDPNTPTLPDDAGISGIASPSGPYLSLIHI